MLSETRLRYLYESARLGTMRAASEHLDVAASSVSRQISELEKELGITLFERGRQGVSLTEAGRTVFEFYRERAAHEEAFMSRISDLRSVRTGNIILGLGEAFVTDEFSDLLRRYMKQYDGLKVHVRMGGSNSVVAMVRNDEAHFGLMFDIPRDPRVRARTSLPQPLHFVVQAGHPLASTERPGLTELGRYRVALPESSFRIRQIVQRAEQESGEFLEPALITNSMTLLKDFVKSGRGVTVLPPLLTEPERSQGRLVAVPTGNAVLNDTQITLVTRVGRQLPVGVYRLMVRIESFLRKNFGAVPLDSPD
ncbi:LysR family transcriptional regulator [Elongatibacter sediminis]|uniref:LysR family transcriptional regulator n=1 Tax=Elongatibacter sediminis TaxID=3119006 RepID=A0AAW9R9A8_9GAMM